MVTDMSNSPLTPSSVSPLFDLRWQVGGVFVFNSFIAIFLTAVFGDRFGPNTFWLSLAYSQFIGFSIFASIHGFAVLAGRARRPTPRDLALGVGVGTVLGTVAGGLSTGTWDTLVGRGWSGVGLNVFLGLVFGTVAAYIYSTTLRNAQAQVELKERALRHLSAEKSLSETRLRLLQAQIEPHFLFNTLSTIHSLIDTHPQRAARMLESLTHYLRASLEETREGDTCLRAELKLVEAYLGIQRERMGERLRWRLQVPDHLLACSMPPMLIQPLVENAVKHGIEPSVEGGEVTVVIAEQEGGLRIEVADTGSGLGTGGARAGTGVGCANVSARLAGRYGADARLSLEPNPPRGARAVMTLPMACPPGATDREQEARP